MRQSELIMKWALKNYASGGHWIVETMSLADIDELFHNFLDAKKYVELMQEQEKNCRE